jgi:hypothetical protein
MQPLTQSQALGLIESHKKMRSLNVDHIQNRAACRSRLFEHVLNCEHQHIGVIVCAGKLVQQNNLPVCRLPPPKRHDLLAGDPLQQFVF